MAIGFKDAKDFAPVVGWKLYQVTLNKYHVMFYFENGWQLLNIAHSFSHRAADGTVDYTFEIYGTRKKIEVDRLLNATIADVVVEAPRRLTLVFDNDDRLVIHDDPNIRSWWFMAISNPDRPESAFDWEKSDADFEDLTEEELRLYGAYLDHR